MFKIPQTWHLPTITTGGLGRQPLGSREPHQCHIIYRQVNPYWNRLLYSIKDIIHLSFMFLRIPNYSTVDICILVHVSIGFHLANKAQWSLPDSHDVLHLGTTREGDGLLLIPKISFTGPLVFTRTHAFSYVLKSTLILLFAWNILKQNMLG